MVCEGNSKCIIFALQAVNEQYENKTLNYISNYIPVSPITDTISFSDTSGVAALKSGTSDVRNMLKKVAYLY